MILRMSSLFVRTLREDPADAEVPSHRLLVRAGYIRRTARHLHLAPAGPAGAAQRDRGIIREEMDAIGARSSSSPRCFRGSPTRRATGGRRTATASSACGTARAPTTSSAPPTRRCSRSRSRTCTPPTRTSRLALPDPDQVPRRGTSARRRPARTGVHHEGLLLLRHHRRGTDRSYAAHREAYVRTFDRLGFDYVIVKATSGAMGGSKSEVPGQGRRGRGHLRPVHPAATTRPTWRRSG